MVRALTSHALISCCLFLTSQLVVGCWADFPPLAETDAGGTCGDGVLQQGELCDGADLGGETCSTIGHRGGTLGCTATCSYDTTDCVLWHPGWEYRRPITVTNAGAPIDATDVLIELDTETLVAAAHLESGCADLRFVDMDNETELPHFVEAGCDTTSSQIWIHVTNLEEGTDRTFWMYYGNPSVPAVDTWDGTFIAIHLQQCPDGWDPVADLNANRFVRGNTGYGTIVDAASQSHAVATFDTCKSSQNLLVDTSGDVDFIAEHTHQYSLTFLDNPVLPPYLNVLFCRARELYLPQTLVALFDVSDPNEFDRVQALDGKFPRGATDLGVTGGFSQHTHSYDPTTTSTEVGDEFTDGTVGVDPDPWAATPGYTHSIPGSDTVSATSLPPYLDVFFGRAASSDYAVPGIILMVTELPPHGWSPFTPLNADGRFPRGSPTPGARGGDDGHQHDIFFAGDETEGGTGGTQLNSTTVPESGNGMMNYHRHNLLGGTDCQPVTDRVQHLPRYHTVIFAQRQESLPTEVGEEELR